MRKVILMVATIAMALLIGCNKDSSLNSSSSSLYVPTNSDTTANATLSELQQGRTLYINNCGACHGLHSPDEYSVSSWKSIIPNMAGRTGMTSSQITLVTKYVCRGKQ